MKKDEEIKETLEVIKRNKEEKLKMNDNSIIDLQKKYLETGDDTVLEELYLNILRLSYHLLKYGNYYPMDYNQKGIVVKEIASSIICRLIKNKKMIITDNPISYLSRSILYASNPTRRNKIQFILLEDYEDDILFRAEQEPENEVIKNDFSQYIDDFINNRLESTEEINRETLKKAFFDCLSIGKHYTKYIYKLSNTSIKREFKNIMEDFHKYLKDYI